MKRTRTTSAANYYRTRPSRSSASATSASSTRAKSKEHAEAKACAVRAAAAVEEALAASKLAHAAADRADRELTRAAKAAATKAAKCADKASAAAARAVRRKQKADEIAAAKAARMRAAELKKKAKRDELEAKKAARELKKREREREAAAKKQARADARLAREKAAAAKKEAAAEKRAAKAGTITPKVAAAIEKRVAAATKRRYGTPSPVERKRLAMLEKTGEALPFGVEVIHRQTPKSRMFWAYDGKQLMLYDSRDATRHGGPVMVGSWPAPSLAVALRAALRSEAVPKKAKGAAHLNVAGIPGCAKTYDQYRSWADFGETSTAMAAQTGRRPSDARVKRSMGKLKRSQFGELVSGCERMEIDRAAGRKPEPSRFTAADFRDDELASTPSSSSARKASPLTDDPGSPEWYAARAELRAELAQKSKKAPRKAPKKAPKKAPIKSPEERRAFREAYLVKPLPATAAHKKLLAELSPRQRAAVKAFEAAELRELRAARDHGYNSKQHEEAGDDRFAARERADVLGVKGAVLMRHTNALANLSPAPYVKPKRYDTRPSRATKNPKRKPTMREAQAAVVRRATDQNAAFAHLFLDPPVGPFAQEKRFKKLADLVYTPGSRFGLTKQDTDPVARRMEAWRERVRAEKAETMDAIRELARDEKATRADYDRYWRARWPGIGDAERADVEDVIDRELKRLRESPPKKKPTSKSKTQAPPGSYYGTRRAPRRVWPWWTNANGRYRLVRERDGLYHVEGQDSRELGFARPVRTASAPVKVGAVTAGGIGRIIDQLHIKGHFDPGYVENRDALEKATRDGLHRQSEEGLAEDRKRAQRRGPSGTRIDPPARVAAKLAAKSKRTPPSSASSTRARALAKVGIVEKSTGGGAVYDTRTKPALRSVERAAGGDLDALRKAVDAANAAGATKNEIVEAVGGSKAWNALVKHVKKSSQPAKKSAKGKKGKA